MVAHYPVFKHPQAALASHAICMPERTLLHVLPHLLAYAAPILYTGFDRHSMCYASCSTKECRHDKLCTVVQQGTPSVCNHAVA